MARIKFNASLPVFLVGLVLLASCTGTTAENRLAKTEPEQPVEPALEATPTASAGPPTQVVEPSDSIDTGQTPTAIINVESVEEKIVGGTNIARHSVPLEDIHFDLFNGSSLPLSRITEATVLNLRDAIPPVNNPVYESVAEADEWLTANDLVIGYVDGDEALAYPVRILNYHEIVNETVNNTPILISYCPLCSSGIVYDRRLNGEVLEFGNTSALYNSDMVMYDQQTLSYWFQVEGEAIVGDLTGQRLALLPTQFMRWTAWREAYPDSRVLSRNTGFDRPYERDPFTRLPDYLNAGRFPFPVDQAAYNNTLQSGEKIIGLVLNDEARAYSLERLAGSVANDEVGNRPVAVVVDDAQTARAFIRQIGGETLTLTRDGDILVDEETGSRWTDDGLAISGPLEGEQMEIVPARFSFWFAFVVAFPEATVFGE